jgi:UDP-2-acetamido-3-amino-2,3-dideoxy-glucuronate N-acetyltransferase
MKTKPNIAVIGSGYWGKNLVRNFDQLGALKLICDKNEHTLCQFKDQYPEVDVCMAYSDVLNRDDIHGVVIATPAETHYFLAKEAILAGNNVYVEKPLVLDEKEGEELITLAKKHNRVLMVGHLLQYHPAFIRLKELVKGGELGRINYIYSNRLNLGKIRREENVFWSFAPHDISMILTLAGELPDKVSATGGCYLHKTIADVTTTHLEFSSGLKAHIFVSWLHPFKEQKLVVVGDKKMAVFDDMKPWEEKLLVYSHEIHWDANIPVPVKAEPERIEIIQSEPLKNECQHFLECILEAKQPITDGSEGLGVLKMLKAGQKSLEAKGQSIKLAKNEDGPVSNSFSAHPTAVIDSGCEIGEGTKIWHFSHVLTGSKIADMCNIGQNVVIGPDVTIGKGCKIQNNVSVYKGVTLEDGVFCGPSMVFTNIYNPRAEITKMDQVRPTLVRKGATIGANATIVCGVTIGNYAFIGAGAVVINDVPDNALVVGNPGKVIGWACDCGDRLTDSFKCESCGKEYTASILSSFKNTHFGDDDESN